MARNDKLDPLEALESLDTEPEPSEYDQDLGREVGEAAMRVANGELSEERFHEQYHERFKAEFGDEYVAPEGVDDE